MMRVVLLFSVAIMSISNAFASEELMKAVWSGDIENVKKRLEAGDDVNYVNQYGDTPLHNAANFPPPSEPSEIAKLLLEKGANVNAINNEGRTPLKIAISRADYGASDGTEMAQLFISRRADPNLGGPNSDPILINLNRPEIAKLLIDAGAQVNSEDHGGVRLSMLRHREVILTWSIS